MISQTSSLTCSPFWFSLRDTGVHGHASSEIGGQRCEGGLAVCPYHRTIREVDPGADRGSPVDEGPADLPESVNRSVLLRGNIDHSQTGRPPVGKVE